ncbi:MAG: type II toxin-antitoxin system HicA family toxin [Pseudonocardiaceae bacterium]
MWSRWDVPLKVGEMIKLLESDGWYLVRVRGSHRHYRHPGKPGTATVAGKPSDTLPPGTERSILRQAGIQRRSQ